MNKHVQAVLELLATRKENMNKGMEKLFGVDLQEEIRKAEKAQEKVLAGDNAAEL